MTGEKSEASSQVTGHNSKQEVEKPCPVQNSDSEDGANLGIWKVEETSSDVHENVGDAGVGTALDRAPGLGPQG